MSFRKYLMQPEKHRIFSYPNAINQITLSKLITQIYGIFTQTNLLFVQPDLSSIFSKQNNQSSLK